MIQLLTLLHALSERHRCLVDSSVEPTADPAVDFRLEPPAAGVAGGAPPRSGTLTSRAPALPPSAFLNRKLNAKLLRQLQDPLALCSRSFPSWCAQLTLHCPFLFSFESRRLLLSSTEFGLARALQRLQAHTNEGSAGGGSSAERSEQARLGRLPRQKLRITRSGLLESAIKVMDLYASNEASIEVEYFGEVGTGLGPTQEFYTLVSRELRREQHGLWLSEESPPPLRRRRRGAM